MKHENTTKTKTLKIACCIVLLVMLCMTMTACIKTKDIGDFTVTYSDEGSPTYYIVGISQAGKQKEELVLPSTINGIRVGHLGSRIQNSYLESKNLKKLFWGGNQGISYPSLVTGCVNLRTLVLTSPHCINYNAFFNEQNVRAFLSPCSMRIVLSDSVKEWMSEECIELFERYYDFISPNVYYKDGFDSTTDWNSWIDYLEPGDKIKTVPDAPKIEGYEFTGWYIDKQCTILADFDNIVKADADLTFYAGWKQI